MKKILSLVLSIIMIVCTVPMALAEDNTYKAGDIIQFGSYPQSEVTDVALIVELNALAPEWAAWTSYGYYSGDGNNGSMVQGDWMRYTDVIYNGNKYRGVKFTQYRPNRTTHSSSSENSYQDDNGYYISTIYWFKFEAIAWRVLDPYTGLIICDTTIDSQPFQSNIYGDHGDEYNDFNRTKYASDYEASSIRKWLNDNFYNASFTETEKVQIINTFLNNNSLIKGSQFDCIATYDKIFLMSYDEAQQNGLVSNSNNSNDITKRSSDYARIQGDRIKINGDNENYYPVCLLRTASNMPDQCCVINYNSRLSYMHHVEYLSGVRPAMKIGTISSKKEYKKNDIIQLGSYPQTKVTESTVIKELNTLSYQKDWISYNYYYKSSEGTPIRSDYMKYVDVVYNNNKYRGVNFSEYRPVYSGGSYSNQDNYYAKGYTYWFKFEPIYWRILDPITGLLMCETIIDSQPFQEEIYYNYGTYYVDPSYTKYASDYEASSIRKWLNYDFYNIAFTEDEKEKIRTTSLENTNYIIDDKVFLLSIEDVKNIDFGFNGSESMCDGMRRARGSDYAKCQGLGGSTWLLRTANGSNNCFSVFTHGKIGDSWDVNYCVDGIRPAMTVNFHHHSYEPQKIIPATHLTEGVKTFICECGDVYTEVIVKLEGHTYTSKITTPATHLEEGVETFTCECGETYIETVSKLTDHTYISKVTTPATHFKEGIKTFTCNCGDTYTEPVAKLEEHTYTSEVTKEPTHLEEGEMTFTCECGESYTEAIKKIAKHNYKADATEPTCTAKGYTTYTCECGDIYVADYTEAKGHIYSATTTQPTCTQNGLVTTFCTSCGDTYTETLEPTGHSFAEGSSKCENCDFDKADDCSCNCHKGGISGLIFKIILFFQRIFKTNKTCACGIAHY